MVPYLFIYLHVFDLALSLRVQDARVEIGRSEVVGLQVGITASSTTSVYMYTFTCMCTHVYVHTCTTVAHVHVCTHTCSVTCNVVCNNLV